MSIILLFSPTYAWFYILNSLIFEYSPGPGDVVDYVFIGEALWLISIAVSALIGSMICGKYNRNRFFTIWILFGLFATALFGILNDPSFFAPLSVLLGSSIGLGLPCCFAYIADNTVIEERARISGVAILVVFILLIIVGGIIDQLGFFEAILLTVMFRGLSFLGLLINPVEPPPKKEVKWSTVINTNGFGLYFLSWFLFMAAGSTVYFVNQWIDPNIPNFAEIDGTGYILMNMGVIFAGFISGFISDRIGRKNVIIFGIGTLMSSYALFGVFGTSEIFILTQLFYGASWGIVFTNYFMTVIGDLSNIGSREKFYAVGIMVLFLNMGLQLISELFSGLRATASVISAILSIILFFSLLTVVIASETLPQTKIRERKLREHVKKVGKIVKESRNTEKSKD